MDDGIQQLLSVGDFIPVAGEHVQLGHQQADLGLDLRIGVVPVGEGFERLVDELLALGIIGIHRQRQGVLHASFLKCRRRRRLAGPLPLLGQLVIGVGDAVGQIGRLRRRQLLRLVVHLHGGVGERTKASFLHVAGAPVFQEAGLRIDPLLGDDFRLADDQRRIAVQGRQDAIKSRHDGVEQRLPLVVAQVFFRFQAMEGGEAGDGGPLLRRDAVKVHGPLEQVVHPAVGQLAVERILVQAGEALHGAGVGEERGNASKEKANENPKSE